MRNIWTIAKREYKLYFATPIAYIVAFFLLIILGFLFYVNLTAAAIELLLTAPVRDFELVVGKWLGGFLFLVSLVAVTWIFPIVLNWMSDPGIDQGPLMTGYLGIVLICAALIAIGVAVSAFFSNQISAFFVTLGVVLLLWLIGMPARATGAIGGSLLSYLDFSEHFYQTLYQGVIDLADVVYYLSVTALALLIGTIAIEFRRWR
jgi:ABC-2 type transport system permease protein